MPPKKKSDENVICPTCWDNGTRSVMDGQSIKNKKLTAGDRFPSSITVWSAAYVCKGCDKTYKE